MLEHLPGWLRLQTEASWVKTRFPGWRPAASSRDGMYAVLIAGHRRPRYDAAPVRAGAGVWHPRPRARPARGRRGSPLAPARDRNGDYPHLADHVPGGLVTNHCSPGGPVTDHNGSQHDRYRERLAALATNRGPIEEIVEAGGGARLWPVERQWVWAYGRFFPGCERFVNMVFETAGDPQYVCCVEGFTTRPEATKTAAYLAERPEGWLTVTPFPCDDRLPTLTQALARPG